MMKHHIFSALLLSSIPVMSFAFFCPTNFNQIQMGFTTAQVTAACGKPDIQQEVSGNDDNVPQQWSYYIPQTNIIGPRTTPQGSQQTIFSFDQNGSVINIMANNVSVGTSNLCGQNVQLGDSRSKVKSACGTPAFINKQQSQSDSSSGSSAPASKSVKYFYNTKPPMTLIFSNGVLTDKK